MRVRVAVNGYGTIGKRVADAVRLQDDMELIGVAKTRPTYEAISAVRKGIPLYVPRDAMEEFEKRGIRVAGTIEDLLSRADVVVDATPGGVGATYKTTYLKLGLKAVFQGGERPEVADVSFSSLCNYTEALLRSSARVVSCNTTGILRSVCSLLTVARVDKTRVFIVRRAADPKERDRGPVNSIVLDPPRIPSHHAVDAKTVVRDLDILTAAVAVPTTLMHTHFMYMSFRDPVSKEDIIEALSKTKRIVLVESEAVGMRATSDLVELARDLGRARYDIPELIVWRDTIHVNGHEVFFVQSVHQESIVIPENIDAIRALTGIEKDAEKAIKKTDETLRLGEWLP